MAGVQLFTKTFAKLRLFFSSIPPTLWLILLLSVVIGLTGLKWGAPQLWHPDEFIRFILMMGQNKDLNPHYFLNPSLPLYIGGAMLVPYYSYLLLFKPELITLIQTLPATAGSLSQVPAEFMIAAIVLIRLASVIMSLLTLIVVYKVAENAFGKRTALFTSFFLSLSPLFIAHMKFAVVGSYLNFFLGLALFFEQKYLRSGKQQDLRIAAAAVGLAMASKYTGLFGLFFLGITILLKENPRTFHALGKCVGNWDFIKVGAIAGIIFIIVNPWPILAFDEVVKENLLHGNLLVFSNEGAMASEWLPSIKVTRGWIHYPLQALRTLSLPLFIISLLGMSLITKDILSKRKAFDDISRLRLHLLLWVLLYYGLFIGAFTKLRQRHLLPLVPVMVLFAAYALVRLMKTEKKRKTLVRIAVAVLILFAFFNAGIVLYEFVDETRNRAGAWLEENLQPGESIGYFTQQWVYLPEFPKGVESQHLTYVDNITLHEDEFARYLRELSISGPDYLLLTSNYYLRFYRGDKPNSRTQLYDGLLEGRHPVYKPIAKFEQHKVLGYSTELDFLGPTILVLERTKNI